MSSVIALLTSFWDRPNIEEITIDYYASLRDNFELPLLLAAAYSDETQDSTVARARSLGWLLFKCPREPLGLKLNTASRVFGASSVTSDVTHVVTCGSDDLIHPLAFRALCAAGQQHEAVGFSGAYFLCSQSWRAAHFVYPPTENQRPCGAGRILQRHVLDKLDWAPRNDDAKRSLDGSMDECLRSIGVWWHILEHKSITAPVLDVKTARNLSSFENLLRAGATKISPEDLCDAFGDPWASRLRALKPSSSYPSANRCDEGNGR